MKKIFVFSIDHVIDIITNSSSELFILKGKSKEIVEEMIKSKYQEYRTEYNEIKNITELDADELDQYIDYEYFCYDIPRDRCRLIPGFSFEEMYEIKKRFGRDCISLKRNEGYRFVTSENKEKIINGLSPNKDMYFLFSIDENPNWEMQEELMAIATRYHLG